MPEGVPQIKRHLPSTVLLCQYLLIMYAYLYQFTFQRIMTLLMQICNREKRESTEARRRFELNAFCPMLSEIPVTQLLVSARLHHNDASKLRYTPSNSSLHRSWSSTLNTLILVTAPNLTEAGNVQHWSGYCDSSAELWLTFYIWHIKRLCHI